MAFVCSILTIVKKSELIREISGKKIATDTENTEK